MATQPQFDIIELTAHQLAPDAAARDCVLCSAKAVLVMRGNPLCRAHAKQIALDILNILIALPSPEVP